MDCIDLREWAKPKRYRTRLEESHSVEQDSEVRGDGRWYVEVVCHRGLIYPFGGDELLAWVPRRAILRELLDIPTVKIHQGGDHEGVVRFPQAALNAVARVLRPRLRRTGRPEGPSPEVRAAGLRAIAEKRQKTSPNGGNQD